MSRCNLESLPQRRQLLSLGQRTITEAEALKIVNVWLETASKAAATSRPQEDRSLEDRFRG